MKVTLSILTLAALLSFSVSVTAADKVVVIPMGSSHGHGPEIPTVTSAGDRVWMDRNLGADRVAGSKFDLGAYGNYYQWGRLADGHDYSMSPTQTTPSPGDIPGHGSFILDSSDWRASKNDNLWQGAAGINNPCPDGFRLPTVDEWEDERNSWDSNNADGAFASNLKLPMAGWRNWYTPGDLSSVGDSSCYWSSTVAETESLNLYCTQDDATMRPDERSYGCSVRCIQD